MRRRVRWKNVIRVVAATTIVVVVVAWPRLAPPEPELPGNEAIPLPRDEPRVEPPPPRVRRPAARRPRRPRARRPTTRPAAKRPAAKRPEGKGPEGKRPEGRPTREQEELDLHELATERDEPVPTRSPVTEEKKPPDPDPAQTEFGFETD